MAQFRVGIIGCGRPWKSQGASGFGMSHFHAHGYTASADATIVVLADTSRRHAFQVDALVGQRDVVLEGLSPSLPHLPAVAGASVEPDGSVLIVLDPPGLIARARQHNHVSTAFTSTRTLPGMRASRSSKSRPGTRPCVTAWRPTRRRSARSYGRGAA